MHEAAEQLDFERAAELRDQLRALRRVQEKQKVISGRLEDQDLVGCAHLEDQVCVQVFFVREGKVVGREHFMLDGGDAREPGEVLALPDAHGEGRYIADGTVLEQLKTENRVMFRYAAANGDVTDEADPNGSADHIAGVLNGRGNVCGLMPHPERAVEALLGSTDGRKLFASAFASLTRAS